MSRPAVLVLSNDNVRRRSLDEYERDRERVAGALRAAGAERVFEIGHLGAPGISDVDLVACFPDGFDWRRPARGAAAHALSHLPDTFLHPPWAIRARHIADLPALFALSRLCDLEAGELAISAQTDEQRLFWNVEACASVLAMLALRTARMSTRSALCLLHGINYNLALAGADGIRPVGGAEFSAAIADLRARWFQMQPQAREGQLVWAWSRGSALLESLLLGYGGKMAAQHDERGLRAAAGFDLPVPGTRLVYRFMRAGGAPAPATRLLRHVLELPPELGVVFRLLAQPGAGLERWLAPRFHDPLAEHPLAADPRLAEAAHSYASANAAYLADVLESRMSLLALNGGTLAHLHTRRPVGWRARAGRVARRLAGISRIAPMLRWKHIRAISGSRPTTSKREDRL